MRATDYEGIETILNPFPDKNIQLHGLAASKYSFQSLNDVN